MILDDIARDTYENNRKRQDRENIDDPQQYEEGSLTYDQYQREREEMMSEHEK